MNRCACSLDAGLDITRFAAAALRAARSQTTARPATSLRTTFYLHCQPGGLFFSFQDPVAQELRIHALHGRVRLSGDEGFEPA